MLELADAAERLRSQQTVDGWLADHAHLIDDIRAALRWSLSPAGDLRLGAALVGASAPLWFALSLMAEYLGLVEEILAALGPQARLEPAREVALREAHGHSLWHIRGTGPEAVATFQRAMDIADKAGSLPDRMRVMWGLWLISNSSGDYGLTMRLAQRFGELAQQTKDPGSDIVYHRMMTMSMHFNGRHLEARHHAQLVLDQPLTTNLSARNSGFHFDQRATALTSLARILWVLGYPEQALDHAERAVQRAMEINHSLSLCFALSIGCTPVAFWTGDGERAVRYTRLLQDRSREYSLSFWQQFGDGYDLVLRRRQGHMDGLQSLGNPAQSLRDTLATLDADLADDAAFDRGMTGAVPWSAPELLRIEGERLKKAGRTKEAEAKFRSGLELARQQQALSWELRCAVSLAMLLQDTRHAKTATTQLKSVYDRFTEGFETADLRSAAELLKQLH
jgi:predicted ATPase